MLLTGAAFIFVLGILIFIHELGHFLVAKKVGIRVEKFSLGFPPNAYSRKIGDTTYCIGIIPLGGYVKMAGEYPTDEATGAPNEFMSKGVAQRAAVIFAGPFMNYLLAIVLLIGVLYFGGEPIFDPDRVAIVHVQPDTPASRAGLKAGDEILSVDGIPVHRPDSLGSVIHAKIEKPVDLVWRRKGDTMSATITTMKGAVPDPDGAIDSVGLIGVMLGEKIAGYRSVGLWESVQDGFVVTHVLVWLTVKFVKRYATGQESLKMVGGPLFIAQQSGREVRKGAVALFRFIALLSVNLAVLNVLPIPVLDGGHLVFLGIERLRGSPLSMKVRVAAQQIGLIVLLSLIVLVTYNDILRIVKGF
jgi:regulator of sigma E protease